ncbi:MAG TPA: hypothetical protein VMH86_11940 [Rhizomicrobium sp.]|nr:hypothetical protein [Rhizomicrobium sp.]
MKRMVLAAVAAAILYTPVCAPAQTVDIRSHRGIFGLLNPDGTFKPLVIPQPAPEALSAKTWNGTLSATISVNVQSTLPSGTTVHCALTASVSGIAPNGWVDVVSETAQVTATGSGSNLTCHVTMPYQWLLYASTSAALERDTVQVGYEILAVNSSGDGRTTLSSVATISLPAPGATTNYNINARI